MHGVVKCQAHLLALHGEHLVKAPRLQLHEAAAVLDPHALAAKEKAIARHGVGLRRDEVARRDAVAQLLRASALGRALRRIRAAHGGGVRRVLAVLHAEKAQQRIPHRLTDGHRGQRTQHQQRGRRGQADERAAQRPPRLFPHGRKQAEPPRGAEDVLAVYAAHGLKQYVLAHIRPSPARKSRSLARVRHSRVRMRPSLQPKRSAISPCGAAKK